MEPNFHIWLIIPGVLGFLLVFFTPIMMMMAETKRHRDNPRQINKH
ncbi:hypothetical protein AADG42_17650 [Ammonicoccus fulvus]|uniref:Uncharacterized protein n=1 Tax=Ammonicoccus fulvus TaxID=3138240 RepID=A0ABZ3FTK1_9ACTN